MFIILEFDPLGTIQSLASGYFNMDLITSLQSNYFINWLECGLKLQSNINLDAFTELLGCKNNQIVKKLNLKIKNLILSSIRSQ